MEKAGIAIPKILEENRLLTPYKLYQAKLSWSSIVGVQIAKYSYIQQFDQKTAVVAVLNSVWMNQLFMHKKQLIEKINTFIHEPYIRDIRFVRSGRKPAAVVYETFEGEEEEAFPAEKLKNIICIKAEFFWDDLGAFSALGRIHEKDKDNNVIIGNVYTKESKNNIIINDDNDFITVDGINNLTIVKSNGALLIYSDNQDAKIKEILKDIREKEELKDNTKYL